MAFSVRTAVPRAIFSKLGTFNILNTDRYLFRFNSLVQESSDQHSAEVRPPARVRTPAERRAPKHLEARC